MENKNCFDIIRLIAAFLVLYSHHYALSGLKEPVFLGFDSFGGFAVVIFFSVSGYLITSSYLRSKDKLTYIKKRALRIYPALIVCFFFMIFIVCPIFGEGKPLDYIFSTEPFRLLSKGLRLSNHIGSGDIINNFSKNYFFSDSINGSLWTLQIEAANYIFILAILFSKNHVMKKIGFFFFTTAFLFAMNKLINQSELPFINYSMSFAAGSLAGLLIKRDGRFKVMFIIIGFVFIAFLFLSENRGIIPRFLYFSVLPSMIVSLCLLINDKIINRKFDFSYGIYIYAFPIQQIIINELNLPFYQSIAVSILLVIMLAFLSWHIVEKRFLGKSENKRAHLSMMRTGNL